MAEPIETDADRLRELGRIAAPFLTIYIAVHLAAARYGGTHLNETYRKQILDECLEDAVYLLKVI